MELVIAMTVFLVHHLVVARPIIKRTVIEKVGKAGHLALYWLFSTVFLAWVAWSYVEAPYIEIWPASDWARNLALLINPLVVILITCGYYDNRSNSLMGRDYTIGREIPWVARISSHPVMCAVALFCLTHMAVNGDVASQLLFGANALLAIAGMMLMDAKRREKWGEETWEAFAAETSALPFVALLMRRTRLRLSEVSWVPVLAGLGLYFAILFSHPILFGVSAFLE